MKQEDHYCGECRHFGYEDVYGMGECLKDVEGRLSKIRYCGEYSCNEFDIDLNEIEL